MRKTETVTQWMRKWAILPDNMIDVWILFETVLPLLLKYFLSFLGLMKPLKINFSKAFSRRHKKNKTSAKQTFKWIDPQSQKWKCCCTTCSCKESTPVIANRKICRCYFNWKQYSSTTESNYRWYFSSTFPWVFSRR